jgi:hypothetical protein
MSIRIKLNEFHIGQKVRCIRTANLFDSTAIELGKVYTVLRISGVGTIMLEEVNKSNWFNENRFELYNDYLPEELFEL